LLGELLVRFILCKQYGAILIQLEFGKNLHGKPFLCQYPFFHYNVAHSGEWVVCAVHDKKIGVDVEKILPFDLQLAKGFFTGEEYWELSNTKEERNTAFYDMWTLKERYVKAQGRGLSIPLDSFNMKRLSSDSITLTDMNTGKAITDFTCKQYRINNQYRLSVCANHENIDHFAKLPILVSFNNICEDLKIALSG
jgi:4'-phosphopantetheinyl transferase